MEVVLIAAAGLIARDLTAGIWEDGGWDWGAYEGRSLGGGTGYGAGESRIVRERAGAAPRSKVQPRARDMQFFSDNQEFQKGARGVRIEESAATYYGIPMYKAYVGYSNVPVFVGNPKALNF